MWKQGAIFSVQVVKENRLENDPASPWVKYLSKHFPNWFTVSITGFNCSIHDKLWPHLK